MGGGYHAMPGRSGFARQRRRTGVVLYWCSKERANFLTELYLAKTILLGSWSLEAWLFDLEGQAHHRKNALFSLHDYFISARKYGLYFNCICIIQYIEKTGTIHKFGAGVRRLVGWRLDIQSKDYPISTQYISKNYPNPVFILNKSKNYPIKQDLS